ncbi:MAG: Gfo/Idh/MocA family oxidoreductase [Planctomycetaceae bacterium]|nr:Gfo/Idh/MocA family oxidoreductase [Planctomycetaceae bacterium]
MKPNRRNFLKTAALTGLAVPFVVASHQVRGAAANERIRLGVVGCGGRGAWITGLFAKDGNYEIVSVADYHRSVAVACGRSFSVPEEKCFSGLSGYKKVLNTDIDAIALEAVPYFFPEHVRASVEAGKHVFMAKPVAVDIWGTRTVHDLAVQSQKNGKIFLVDFQIPTNENNRNVLACVKNDEIGRIHSINTCYITGSFGDPAFQSFEERLQHLVWVNDDILGGSYHVNACIHGIEAGLELLDGELPASAQGSSFCCRPNPHGDSHNMYALTFDYEDGRIWSHQGFHHLSPFHVRAVGYGEKGVAEIGYVGRAGIRGPQREEDFGEIADLYQAGAVSNIAKFADAMRKGDVTNDTVDISINANYVTILGREAGKRRNKTTLAELMQENHRYELDTSDWAHQ